MHKDNQTYLKTSLSHKITLILSSVLLFIILLEAGLRLGGFILLSLQEHRNLLSIKQKGTYRIMCLGESTTAGQYPPFLEEVLNQRNIGIQFSVIDKGVPGTNTSAILSQLESNLEKYKPDMVTTMMGINDSRLTLSDEDISASKNKFFPASFKVYNLGKLLYLSALAKIRVLDVMTPSFTIQHINEEKEDPKMKKEFLGNKRVLGPDRIAAHIQTGNSMLQEEKYPEAEIQFQEALALDPRNNQALTQLGRLYREQGRFLQAEQILKEAIGIDPKDVEACIQLGRLYRDYYHELDKAETWFRKAIELWPNCYEAYYELGVLYGVRHKFSEAEEIFKKAMEFEPKNTELYFELGWIYRQQNKFSEAEEIFKKALEVAPSAQILYRSLASLNQEINNYKLSQEFYKKANDVKLNFYSSATINNYQKISKILRKRNIKFVCVQYPVRSIQQLKNIFRGEDIDIIFVDNENFFKEAIRKYGFKEIFTDMFAGDFGHCAEKGNRLLAENIANAILKTAFNK